MPTPSPTRNPVRPLPGHPPGPRFAAVLLAVALGNLATGTWAVLHAATEPAAAGIEFFETRVRPVLIESCYPCHSAESGKEKGGLRLDTASAILRGGDTGPALQPGEPDASLLIKAIRGDSPDLQMPPASRGGPLPVEQVEALEAWVAMGAPDPRTQEDAAPRPDPLEAARKHWAFQPITRPEAPRVTGSDGVRTPVDAFVLAKLEANGIAPAPPADKPTLLRRITYDLTGLPPTWAETAAFLRDESPDAYERVVERLLASPRYGERWGRHWLDVARYADTKGYVFQEERRYPYAYTYRDYVIRAFNEDKPFDLFLIEQLAADRLDSGEDRSSLAALGFLTLGRRFLNNPHDIIDDRIDVVARGTLALTMGCARCHDHKFDPIPTEDYYALYGVFASSEEPGEKPLLGDPPDSEPYREFLAAQAAIEAEMEAIAVKEIDAFITTVQQAREEAAKQAETAGDPTPKALDNGDQERLRQVLEAEGEPNEQVRAEARRILSRQIGNATVPHRQRLEALNWTHPGAPARAMAMTDRAQPADAAVFIRGNPGNRGATVPRRLPAVLASLAPEPFRDGSGRLELARAIASPDNPLTARVFVNRVWAWHFGRPLVDTPSDFGVRTPAPVQRELLDWLASEFTAQGWSIKTLHRLIVLSNTYRQSATASPSARAADPDNRLLHHFDRQRLDFEAMRDTLLAVAGRLDLTMGGQPVEIDDFPSAPRRTVYGFIDRQNLPGLFRTFDLASPDLSSPGRFTTTVPQQGLFFLNSPFVLEQSRALAARVDTPRTKADAPFVQALYHELYQREPEPGETDLATAFLSRATDLPKATVHPGGWHYGYGGYDDATERTTEFTPMSAFEGRRVSPKAGFPDREGLGYVSVTADGGHPGPKPGLASIRRWEAPTSGMVRITATLRHPNDQGDGVRARVVSNHRGLLGEWSAHHDSVDTGMSELAVQAGETLDFAVDCRASDAYDSFQWAPVIEYVTTEPEGADTSPTVWDAQAGFASPRPPQPPLAPREQLAQVLLLANELMFVD